MKKKTKMINFVPDFSRLVLIEDVLNTMFKMRKELNHFPSNIGSLLKMNLAPLPVFGTLKVLQSLQELALKASKIPKKIFS